MNLEVRTIEGILRTKENGWGWNLKEIIRIFVNRHIYAKE